MAGKNYVIKVILGFAALFLVYHTSEVVGSNPLWILLPLVLFVPIAHVIGKRLGSGGLAGFGMQRRIAKKHLIWLSSVLYTLNHIWRIEHSYTQWIMLFLMGLTFAIPFARTGSLWFTIGCHWGWNTVAIFKDHIGEQASFQVLDKTSDWLYIVTIAIFLLFVTIRKDRVAKAWKMSYNTDNFIQGIDEKE